MLLSMSCLMALGRLIPVVATLGREADFPIKNRNMTFGPGSTGRMQPMDHEIGADKIDSEREINRVMRSQIRLHVCARKRECSYGLLRCFNAGARTARAPNSAAASRTATQHRGTRPSIRPGTMHA
jgi:hypothetical protein